MNISTIKNHSRWVWLATSIVCLALSIVLGLALIMILNANWANHILTPVFQFLPLFQLLWNDNPAGALWFLVRKSLFTLAHQDPRSGLNLWTFEFHTLSLITYAVTSLFLARLLQKLANNKLTIRKNVKPLSLSLLGAFMVLFSVSFMTSIEHCSGATWVGFVAMYGLGFDEFQLYPIIQWIIALLGVGLYTWGTKVKLGNP